jgi:hypothetical protein
MIASIPELQSALNFNTIDTRNEITHASGRQFRHILYTLAF